MIQQNPPYDIPPALAKLEADARGQECRVDQKAQVTLAFVGALIVALVALLSHTHTLPSRLALYATGALLVPTVRHLLAVIRPRLGSPLTPHGWVDVARTGPSAALAAVADATTGTHDEWLARRARAVTDVCVRTLTRHETLRRAIGWLYTALCTLALALVLGEVTR